jgi:hypothetical protein
MATITKEKSWSIRALDENDLKLLLEITQIGDARGISPLFSGIREKIVRFQSARPITDAPELLEFTSEEVHGVEFAVQGRLRQYARKSVDSEDTKSTLKLYGKVLNFAENK